MENKNYYIYSISTIFSNFGTMLSYFMLIILLSKIELPYKTSILLFFYMIIFIFSTFLSGYFLDKYKKFKILLLSQFFSGIIIFYLGYYLKSINIIILLINLGIVNGVVGNMISTITPLIINKENSLFKFNSFLQIGNKFLGVLVGIIGSFLITKDLINYAFYIDSFSYILATFLYYMSLRENDDLKNNINIYKEKSNYIEIIKILKENISIYLDIIILFVLNLSLVPINIFLPYIIKNMNLKIELVGYFDSCFGMGGLIISILILFYRKNINKYIKYSYFMYLISYFVLILFSSKFMILAMGFILGISSIGLLIFLKTQIQLAIPKNIMGKTMAIQSSLLKLAKPMGMLLGSIWVVSFSIKSYFLFMFIILLIFFICFIRKRI